MSPSSGPSSTVVTTDYGHPRGLKIFRESQLAGLRNPPPGLSDYFRAKLRTGKVGFTVERVRSDGWATGGVNDIYQGEPAGGAAVIWRGTASGWKQVWAGQDVPMCAELHRAHVPANMVIPPKCFADPTASGPVTYRG